MQLQAQFLEVTPETAAEWLDRNKLNRKVQPKRVAKYAQEMQAGRWTEHHQGIAFYKDGTLADGQHRLAAIVESGCTIKLFVAWGLDVGADLDAGQSRSLTQQIQVSGQADWIGTDEVATIKMMMQVRAGNCYATTSASKLEVVEFGREHQAAILFATRAINQKKRYLTNAVTKAAVACAYPYESSARLEDFVQVLTTGVTNANTDKAAVLAREFLLVYRGSSQNTTARMDGVKRVQRAIQAFCKHQPLSKLYQPKDFIYYPKPLTT